LKPDNARMPREECACNTKKTAIDKIVALTCWSWENTPHIHSVASSFHRTVHRSTEEVQEWRKQWGRGVEKLIWRLGRCIQ